MIKKCVSIIIGIFISFNISAENDSIVPDRLYFSHNELYKKPNYAHNPYIIESKYDFS